MSKSFSKGTTVTWEWGQGKAEGVIDQCFKETVHRMLQGSDITRHGTPDNPAYLIEQDSGSKVLKLHSELTAKP